MLNHVWSIICAKSSIDKETNNISLFEVLEQLSFTVEGSDAEKAKEAALTKHIVAPFNFEVVTLLEDEPRAAEHSSEIKLGIVDPKGKTLQSVNHAFSFLPNIRRMRVVVKINGLPVTESGIYRVVVMLKGERSNEYKIVTEIPLEVAVNFKD